MHLLNKHIELFMQYLLCDTEPAKNPTRDVGMEGNPCHPFYLQLWGTGGLGAAGIVSLI